MSAKFQEKRRIRPSDVRFLIILLSAFAALFAVEIAIQLDTKDEIIRYFRQAQSENRLRSFTPVEPSLIPMLEMQGKHQETLLNLSEQNARIAVSMKKRLDAHASRLSKIEKEMNKLLKEEQVARVKERKEQPPKESKPLPKLGPRK